ncbi:uncharacterized protein MICPUCDRAFT_53356 [Micromonas pusilla CCMP1545]|uniref:Predicted protein n=1 Tax=Micromonas pusilla (strain CCMP1545) TaxID=564608 RepID=C1N6L6_MICPC|nr:uncharacterized protein MICPUCDRAFT_53356 [Micromonas pusilla CCMP1545]EEH51944.1 predicted protein [Micromonas pusilla CCMP1545]|eukprot:XP_003063571.1 predicted protein [Micromonas pusilla CCMP1545]
MNPRSARSNAAGNDATRASASRKTRPTRASAQRSRAFGRNEKTRHARAGSAARTSPRVAAAGAALGSGGEAFGRRDLVITTRGVEGARVEECAARAPLLARHGKSNSRSQPAGAKTEHSAPVRAAPGEASLRPRAAHHSRWRRRRTRA